MRFWRVEVNRSLVARAQERIVRHNDPIAMHALYLLSVYLHVLCAIVWIGGIAFLVLVVVPWLRAGGRETASTFLRETGLRFRSIGWACFAVLALTGTFNLWMRNVRFSSFADPEWLASSFGKTIVTKLSVFAAVLATSFVHDFIVGPRAMRAVRADPGSAEAARLRRQASMLGRLNAVFALVLVAVAVMIVRGTPW
jgi:putative copper export protein